MALQMRDPQPGHIADLHCLYGKKNIRAIEESLDRIHCAVIAKMDRDPFIPVALIGFRESIVHPIPFLCAKTKKGGPQAAF